jgi:hypothetical protein
LRIEAEGNDQVLVLRLLCRPQLQFDDASYAIDREVSATARAAKQSFPDQDAFRRLTTLQAKREQTRARLVESQEREEQERYAGERALANLDTDTHEAHFRAAREAKADAALIAEQLAAVEAFVEKARKEAELALMLHINAAVDELGRGAQADWERLAGDIVAGLSPATVLDLFKAGRRLRAAVDWRPHGIEREKSRGLFELPDGVKSGSSGS